MENNGEQPSFHQLNIVGKCLSNTHRTAALTVLIPVECAHLRHYNFIKPSPYVELSVDGENCRKTETVKNTIQPKWNETFTLLVTVQSKINFVVLDRNSFRKDTPLGEHKVDIFELLNYSNGRIDNLELTLDLLNDNKSETPTKCGELTCVLSGLNVDMSKYARTSQANCSMPLSPSNTFIQQRSVLNGIRVKFRGQGTENMVPTSSRLSGERNGPSNASGGASASAALPMSPSSSNNIPNGNFLLILTRLLEKSIEFTNYY